MIRKILLIDADILHNKEGRKKQQIIGHHPIGLMYLISYVRKKFPDIEFRLFHTLTSKEPLKEIEVLINNFKPDMIGLRALSSAMETFRLISEHVRLLNPDILIVAGGPYPSASPHQILENNLCDIVVIGEGEETFSEIIEQINKTGHLAKDIKGTAIKHEEVVTINTIRPAIQDINAIPHPDYNYINLNNYSCIKDHSFYNSSETAYILSSRGCPYNCFYCHQLFGKKIRRRTAADIVAEMKSHITERGIYNFVFLDDVFNMPETEAKDILRKIKADLPDIRINFPNGLRADHIDEEMLDLLEQAGTAEVAFAIESASPRLQKMMGKHLKLDKAEKAITNASRRFITRIFFIIGFPSETFEEAMHTINFASQFEYAANPTLSILRLYHNSMFFKALKPTPEQLEQIILQEQKLIHPEMFGNMNFYGDLFSEELVPLKSSHLKELLYLWWRKVLLNPLRVRNSHNILKKFLPTEDILDFYGGVFSRHNFNEKDLKKILKYD